MAPLDWHRLMQIQVNDLAEDEQRAEDLYDVLGEFEVRDEANVERLQKLFEVTQAIMLLKGTQAMIAEEELAKSAAQQGKSTAKRDQEIEDLKQQLKYQTRKVKDLEMYGSAEAGRSGGGRDTRFLRDELDEMEHQVAMLTRELKDKEKQLHEERQISDRYITRAEDAERELRDVRRENENMHEDIRDYQRQLEAQRETMVTKHDEDVEHQDRLKSRNQMLNKALDENKDLAFENEELLSKIETLKQELRDGKLEIEKTTDDYLKLKLVIQQSDQTIVNLQRENEVLRHQVDDLLEQIQSRGDMDDEIIVKVNRKVEEWKDILTEKDNKNMALQGEIAKLKAKMLAANMDDDKRSVALLTKGIEERDKQIAILEKKLAEAKEDMDTNVILMDDVRAEIRKGAQGGGESHQERITNLLKKLQLMDRCLHEAELKSEDAERDARSKDRQLSEVLEKMQQYEEGIYGLPEAVAEIKELKMQVNVRERQIEELTQYINKCELKINDLFDEVEELRERLGLDPKEPIDLGEFRKKKSVRTQEEKALNQVLRKEIERLEEERINLKQDIRKLAQATGQRALTLGLSVNDVVAVDNFIDDLKGKKNETFSTSAQIKSATEIKELKLRNAELMKELDQSNSKLQRVTESNTETKVRLKQKEEENRGLEKGMREIHNAIKEHKVEGLGGARGAVLECPALEQMLAAMETRSVEGKYDTLLSLKSKVSNLQGHNDELRSVLREVRYEATKAKVDLEKASSKVEMLDAELKALKQAGAGAFFQTMTLPDGMSITSSDVIASLNEHLILVLQEVSLKEDMLEKMEAALETYRRKFAIARHQMGLLYQEHHQEKQVWKEEEEKLREQLKSREGASSEDQVRIQEFDRLVETLATDDVEVRRRLAELTRKVTVLRVNEKALTRRYTSLQEVEGSLRKTISKLKNEMIAMETAVAERLGYLQRYKDMASFKIATLQKQLDTSVPAEDLGLANRRYTELTEKYRDLLGKSNMLVARTEESSGYEVEMKRLQNENNILKKELEIEKEKLHSLEAAFDSMKGQGMLSSKDLRNSEILSISKKMTTLEMKELNERQRAEHAVHMYDMQKRQLRDLEDRNFELEQKFSELTKMHLEAQKVERELRDELAESVTKEVSDADRRRLAELEQTEATLKLEVSKLKDIAEVASCQVRAFEAHQESRDKELMSLRQQLVDFQAQSDEKTVIGKLHRQIVQMQVSEGIALKKLEDSSKKTTKLDAQLLRTEQKLDEKDETIYHNRMESCNKTKHLKHTIHNMRMKYAGAVPLKQQESFASQMIKIQEDKAKIEDDLRQTNEERLKIEDRLVEVEVQHKGLQELIATLKDGRGAQKVAEWHNKMEALRLVELRHKREISRLKEQLKFNEGQSRKHEVEVLLLEEEKVKLEKTFEARELEWDRREVELERIIESMERQQAQIAGAASQFEQAVSSLPDPNWPVPQQLEHAVTTIRTNVKLILDTRAEASVCRKRMEELDQELRETRREVLNRDKVITQLRLRMPATAEREEIFASAVAAVESGQKGGRRVAVQADDFEEKQAVRVAQSTIASLQARLSQKDETLQKYQELLHQARDDATAISQRYEDELKQMQAKLHDRNDAAFAKFKQAIQSEINKPPTQAPTNKQLRRLEQLEDIVSEQDNGLAALREKLQTARQETLEWKYKYEDTVRLAAEERERLKERHNSEIDQLQSDIVQVKNVVDEKDRERGIIEEDLVAQKEANARAPTSTMKRLVERLKNQLAVKEKQQQALSKALLDLRADMVTQAQDDVKANVDKASTEHNIQRLIDRKTKELQERLEELEEQNASIKKALKTRKERESTISIELDDTKQDLVKKETGMKRLKEDKVRLEQEVEELERKVERMSTMAKQKGTSDGIYQELDDLRRKNRLLQEQLKRGHIQAEKPYESNLPQDATTAGSMIARWEENKKWQKVVERQKLRLKDKEEEIQKTSKSNEMLTRALERANRDKESLETKLHRGSASILKQQAAPLFAAPPSGKELHGIEDLRKRNFELEQELSEVKRDLMMGNEKAFEEQRIRNKFLRDKVAALEQQVSALQQQLQVGEGGETSRTIDRQDEEKQSLQKQVLKLSEENIELTFELEQLKKTVPRLRERVSDLQKYVEVLKAEKDELQANDSSAQYSLNSSNVRRIGESGRSTRDLEKTISLLKKIVERSQTEIEQLKKSRPIVSNETLRDLQRDNEGLKTQLSELRMKMGASLSDRYLSQQRGTAKIMTEHDRLRRELLQEVEKNERLRIQLKQQDVTVQHLEKELCDAREKLQIEGARREVNGSDTKGWKSVVATRVYEGKLKMLEEELAKKSSQLSEVKECLRVATDQEESLRRFNDELMGKVRRLEQLPPGSSQHSGSDTDLARDHQVAQLKIEQLERQKTELLNDLQGLREKSSYSSGLNEMPSGMSSKHRMYEKTLVENVELQTQLRSAHMDNEGLRKEVIKLKTELSNFGPEFFEEIEDLKFNYREALKKNVEYEEKLMHVSKQFGVDINLPL